MAVVALSPQQAISSLAQFTQAMAQGNTTPGVGSTQVPPTQYFNIPQQPMGVMSGAAPPQQAVSVTAEAAPNQGYYHAKPRVC